MSLFFESALIAAAGGVACYFLRTAPMIERPFKTWAVYIVAAGTAWMVLARLGVLDRLRQLQ